MTSLYNRKSKNIISIIKVLKVSQKKKKKPSIISHLKAIFWIFFYLFSICICLNWKFYSNKNDFREVGLLCGLEKFCSDRPAYTKFLLLIWGFSQSERFGLLSTSLTAPLRKALLCISVSCNLTWVPSDPGQLGTIEIFCSDTGFRIAKKGTGGKPEGSFPLGGAKKAPWKCQILGTDTR